MGGTTGGRYEKRKANVPKMKGRAIEGLGCLDPYLTVDFVESRFLEKPRDSLDGVGNGLDDLDLDGDLGDEQVLKKRRLNSGDKFKTTSMVKSSAAGVVAPKAQLLRAPENVVTSDPVGIRTPPQLLANRLVEI